jgi:hypothetical protein
VKINDRNQQWNADVISTWKPTCRRETEHVDKFRHPERRNEQLFCFILVVSDLFISLTELVLVEIVSYVNCYNFFCIPFPSLLLLCSVVIRHPLPSSLLFTLNGIKIAHKYLYNKTNQMPKFPKFTPAWNSTCFGQFWVEELPETCRFSCRGKFGKLVQLVVLIIKKFVTMHFHMNVKLFRT